jgi:hypothetical protein
MKTPAIIASLTVVGSIAYAAGSQGVAGKQPPEISSGSRANAMQGEIRQAETQRLFGGPSGNCDPQSEPWFSPQPREFSYDCRDVGRQPFGCADVNRDGTEDYFYLALVDCGLVIDGQPRTTYTYWMFHSELSAERPNSFHSHKNIFPSTLVPGQSLLTLFKNLRTANMQNLGWRDCDGDGDLDLVADMNLQWFGVPDNEVRPFWFENTGYQKPAQPLAADINRDGRVDGADLGLVLVSWGPNP